MSRDFTKVLEFPAVDSRTGDATTQVLSGFRTKTNLVKLAAPVHPEILEFQRSIVPDDRYVYLLNQALGAWETYGCNVNGDAFRREVLKHHPTPSEYWGADTFRGAGIFRHHKNKDMRLSQGDIVLVAYNDRMDRVEIVQKRDLQKMADLGYHDTIEKIRANVPIESSMGCRVKYDVCLWCGNRARSRAEYCPHALHYMCHVLTQDLIDQFQLNSPEIVERRGYRVEPGLRQCVDNPHPRFFDLSDVVMHADVISYSISVLEKAAEEGSVRLSADVASDVGVGPETPVEKSAANKTAEEKLADLIKETPGMSPAIAVEGVAADEPDLPNETLKQDLQPDRDDLLAALNQLGILLHPGEFQFRELCRNGRPDVAEYMQQRGLVIPPSEQVLPFALGDHRPPTDLVGKLLPWMLDRSYFGPAVRRRIVIHIHSGYPKTAAAGIPIQNPRGVPQVGALLEKIAAQYNGYLFAAIERAPQMAKMSELNPHLTRLLESSAQMVEKVAGVPDRLAIYGMFPLLYLFSRSPKEREKGEGAFQYFVRRHPALTASFLAGAATMAPKFFL